MLKTIRVHVHMWVSRQRNPQRTRWDPFSAGPCGENRKMSGIHDSSLCDRRNQFIAVQLWWPTLLQGSAGRGLSCTFPHRDISPLCRDGQTHRQMNMMYCWITTIASAKKVMFSSRTTYWISMTFVVGGAWPRAEPITFWSGSKINWQIHFH